MRPISIQEAAVLASILMVSLLVRWWIAMGSPHSGFKAPPMHGDFEAQRHWIELTTHLPLQDWYVEGPTNNLTYWGLDYPPLTAYHSMLLGYFAKYVRLSKDDFVNAFGLSLSHGSELATTVRFMRESVIISELLVFVPAALAISFFFTVELDPLQWTSGSANAQSTTAQRRRRSPLLVCFMILLNGSLPMLLVDHAHFQYNCVSLGLMLWGLYHAGRHCALQERLAALETLERRSDEGRGEQHQQSLGHRSRRQVPTLSALYHLLASIVCAALSMTFKQMSLYYAIGLGGWYLGECMRYAVFRADQHASTLVHSPVKHASRGGVLAGAFLKAVVLCALAGLGTFAVVLVPFAASQTIPSVVQRVFPVGRGLYEDKVANVWCTISPLVKLPAVAERLVSAAKAEDREGSTRQVTLLLCLLSTVCGCLPAVLAVARGTLTPYAPRNAKGCMWQKDTDPWTATQRACMRSQQRVEQMLWVVLCSALSFYLFSYQVHEKGILLPLLPACALLALLSRRSISVEQLPALMDLDATKEYELWLIRQQRGLLWLLIAVAHFSLFQLAEKDKIVPLFVVMQLVLIWLAYTRCSRHDPKPDGPLRARSAGLGRMSLFVSHVGAQGTLRVLLFMFIIEEFVRQRWLEGNQQYPHLGILSRFAVCVAFFLWMLLFSNAQASRTF